MNVKKFPQRKFEAMWQTYAVLFLEQINVTVWIGWNNWLSGSISLKCKSFFAQKNYQTREIFLVEVQYNSSEGKTSFISWFCKLDGSFWSTVVFFIWQARLSGQNLHMKNRPKAKNSFDAVCARNPSWTLTLFTDSITYQPCDLTANWLEKTFASGIHSYADLRDDFQHNCQLRGLVKINQLYS